LLGATHEEKSALRVADFAAGRIRMNTGARAANSNSCEWRHFLLPLAIYALLAVLYLLAIPSGESPDEPGHLQCIEQVALQGRLPLREPKPSGDTWWARESIIAGQMCYHMPLHYLLAGALLRGAALLDNSLRPFEFPPTNPQFGAEAALFIHDEASLWQQPEPLSLLSVRLLSLLLGLVTVAGSFTLSRVYLPGEPLAATLAAVLAAGWPQLAYLSRAINNDALATALAIMTLLVLVQTGRPHRFVLLAAFSALALLSKITVAFGVAVIGIIWAIEFARYRARRAAYLRAAVIASLIWMAVAILLLAQPVLRQHLMVSSGAFGAIAADAGTVAYWEEVAELTLSSGWARFGWMNLPAPFSHAIVWWIVLGVSWTAGLVYLWRSAASESQRLVLLIGLLWLAAVLLTYLRINVNRLQPQFRFMLAAAPLLTSWAAIGALSPFRDRPRVQWVLIAAAALLLVSYNIWLVLTVVQPAYTV
jgi:hypothetical protein